MGIINQSYYKYVNIIKERNKGMAAISNIMGYDYTFSPSEIQTWATRKAAMDAVNTILLEYPWGG